MKNKLLPLELVQENLSNNIKVLTHNEAYMSSIQKQADYLNCEAPGGSKA